MKKVLILLLLGTTMLACNKKGAEPIHYGTDACELCKMNIMDDKFGAEILNKNGKVFKFDSAECMIDYLLTGAENLEQFFVTNHSHPGTLINANEAIFLYGENIKSPMGGNLAAFGSESDAKKMKQELGGEVLNWNLVKKVRSH